MKAVVVGNTVLLMDLVNTAHGKEWVEISRVDRPNRGMYDYLDSEIEDRIEDKLNNRMDSKADNVIELPVGLPKKVVKKMVDDIIKSHNPSGYIPFDDVVKDGNAIMNNSAGEEKDNA